MVRIQHDDFNALELVAQLRSHDAGAAGALVTFTGYVRDYTSDTTTETLYLEHYPGMCEAEIQTLCDTARKRWNVYEPTVVHRVGELRRQEQIVFVAVASAHRGDAFDACQYIIDALKTRAPFWKRETLAGGETFWVKQHQSDAAKTAAWDAAAAPEEQPNPNPEHQGTRS
jgi:molybdopterin synthase catalytic subunit